MQVFYHVTHSKAGTSFMTAFLVAVLVAGCVTNFATSSRQLWAFVSGKDMRVFTLDSS